MEGPSILVLPVVGLSAVLAGLIAFRADLTRVPGGRILAFIALFLLPVVAIAAGLSQQLQRSKSTQFCLSCHVMEDYGKSLLVDDKSYIPAAHFQNNRVPRDHACFTCHTNYTMYGDFNAKIRGFHHVWAQYVTGPKLPIHLYEPYNNRECLHCHGEARVFLENPIHSAQIDDLRSNTISCLSSGCHDTIHNTGHLDEVKFWKPE